MLAAAIKEMMINETITEAPKDCDDSGAIWESGTCVQAGNSRSFVIYFIFCSFDTFCRGIFSRPCFFFSCRLFFHLRCLPFSCCTSTTTTAAAKKDVNETKFQLSRVPCSFYVYVCFPYRKVKKNQLILETWKSNVYKKRRDER